MAAASASAATAGLPARSLTAATLTPHSGDDYATAFAGELPTGPAWPRDEDSTLMTVVTGLMHIWGDVDSAAATLLQQEADPRTTILMLPDWERNFGLPDLCLAEPVTIANRQQQLLQRMTMSGDPTPPKYVQLAAEIGYAINIWEHAPFMCGVSAVGDTRATGSPDEWYRWEIGRASCRERVLRLV